MDAYKPHRLAAFEGYYTRIQLRTGSSLIFVICTIPNANRRDRAHQATLTYVSASGRIWQQHCWPQDMNFMSPLEGGGNGFRLIGRGENNSGQLESHQGHKIDDSSRAGSEEEYHLDVSENATTIIHKNATVDFKAHLGPPTPWSRNAYIPSPESWLSLLPLPLHWHVYSLSSPCTISLSLPSSAELDPRDAEPNLTGYAHQEKNWAHSFPSAHMWIQAREGDDDEGGDAAHGIVLAGGRILGLDAFLIGYRNEARGISLDFRPPWALRALGSYVGPFMSFDVNWETRTFQMSVRGPLHKLVIRAHAPEGSFYPLASPYKTGHKENWLAQSLSATVKVEVWRKRGGHANAGWLEKARACLFGDWELVCMDKFDTGALEFGGDYYPLRGSDKKWN